MMAKKIDKKPETETTPEKKEAYKPKYYKQFKRVFDTDFVNSLADKMLEWFTKDVGNYMISAFITQPDIMIGRDNILRFCRDNEYFRYIYEQVKLIQEERIANYMAVSDRPTAWIFISKNILRWRDNPEDLPTDEESAGNLTFQGWDSGK